jgi:mannitol-1-phosphate/altronate dehydrogenase
MTTTKGEPVVSKTISDVVRAQRAFTDATYDRIAAEQRESDARLAYHEACRVGRETFKELGLEAPRDLLA